MLECVQTATLVGLEARTVRVEVSINKGTPMIQVVGLAESAVREGRERIRAATKHLGLHVPGLRITVNLAPAGMRKHGAGFDLPITVGILAAAGNVPAGRAGRYAMAGELGLDGSLRGVRGGLPLAAHFRRAGGVDGLLLPRESLPETRPVDDDGFPVLGAGSLAEVVAFLRGDGELPRARELPESPPAPAAEPPDLAEVRGQARAKRALEIAAAGRHGLFMVGEPGCGKTMLARRLPGLLPEMSLPEALEATAVHSVAGRLPPGEGLLRARPFRSPHHSISASGMVGGGSLPRPGEISLAHQGVLFLDEIGEFSARTLEALREPLESGFVTIVRARASATFPARFQLVAAMNPCPCGYHGAAGERCCCDPAAIRRYAGRVSGPLLDRIDLRVEMRAVRWEELAGPGSEEPSAAVRARVRAARERAARRDGEPAGPDAAGEDLLRRAVESGRLSARGHGRVLRVARTIADLEGREAVGAVHVAEALTYRRRPAA